MDPNEQGNTNMGRAKRFLGLTQDESEAVSRLAVPEQAAGAGKSFYDAFAVAGIRVDRVEPGLVVCSFKVPPRLTDRSGNLANGAIASLVDLVGISLEFGEGLLSVSIDMSISYFSTAKINCWDLPCHARFTSRSNFLGCSRNDSYQAILFPFMSNCRTS
ncbi:uncharacterized protein [Malus domestica]|uniref:uncharacterized protein isoform X3 n=1 Tax=Malus domestica TaxID=3750 RepID=UPI003976BC7E